MADETAPIEPAQQTPDYSGMTRDEAALHYIADSEATAAAEVVTKEPVVEASPAAEPVPATADDDWVGRVKAMDIADIVKAKGLPEGAAKVLEHLSKNGNIEDYYKAYSTDYLKVPDIDLLAMQIEEEFGDEMTAEEKEELLALKKEQYKLDDDLYSEEETRRGKIALKADMRNYRKQLVTKQAEMILPTNTPAPQANREELLKGYMGLLETNESFKSIREKGLLPLGPADAPFNMDVDYKTLVSYLTDDAVNAKAHSTPDGQPDVRKHLRIAAYATNPEAFEQKLIDHGRKLAGANIISNLGNEKPNTEAAPVPRELSPAEELAMKIYGR